MQKQKFSQHLITICIVAIIIAIISIYISTHYARDNFSYSIRTVPQNALNWIDPKTDNVPLFTEKKQHKLAQDYLQHYFSPWKSHDANYLMVLKNLKPVLEGTIHNYMRYPGYGINHLPNSAEWVKHIARNMDVAHFPNVAIKVITLENTNMRDLPTHQPAFGNFDEAGQGYPFDHLQVTSIAANTPAILIQKTHDGAWSFIITHNTQGWVPSPTLAIVDNHFIHRWETGHYVALTKNKISIVDHAGLMRFTAGIGKIFPITNNGSILIAVSDANQHAIIKMGKLDHSVAVKWPILLTQRNIAQIMNAMLGVKYGWGGMTDDSDCSLTAMNLFSTFGIWLPRNSVLQAYAWRGIDLRHRSLTEKEKIIQLHGIPFLTLFHKPGHIMIYLGEKQGRITIFQTVWGVDTRFLGRAGRAIIGSTVITPIDLGKHDVNVPQTWFDEVDRMVLVG